MAKWGRAADRAFVFLIAISQLAFSAVRLVILFAYGLPISLTLYFLWGFIIACVLLPAGPRARIVALSWHGGLLGWSLIGSRGNLVARNNGTFLVLAVPTAIAVTYLGVSTLNPTLREKLFATPADEVLGPDE
jgi:hypothetical protein